MTETLDLTLDATYLGLRDIADWLDRVFAAAGWADTSSRGSIELAIHEIAANVVDHSAPADGVIQLRALCEDQALSVSLTDSGTAFEADEYVTPNAEKPQVRGYGLMIVEQVADQLSYDRKDDRNVWSAKFTITEA